MPDYYDPRMYMPFGKFGPAQGDHRAVEEIPSDYLKWLMDQDWAYEKFPDLMSEVEDIYAARERGDAHWHENEEEADKYF